jgi:transposase
MGLADAHSRPLAIAVTSASPHEVTLVDQMLANKFVEADPERMIGDRAYDSDALDEHLAERGIEMISAHRDNRTKAATQDGRPLRRCARRWKIERLWAWLQNYRRIEVRHDYAVENYLGFVLLGCILILLRAYL